MAAVPSIGRASAVEPRPAGPEAQATSLLYERYARQIFNFCLHRLGNREEAEDATQTTFMNAFRGIQRGITPELEQAWLFKIAENVCLTRHRSAFRRRRVESPNNLDVLQEVVPSPQRDSETLIRLTDALTEMPEQQRRALLLREWQGLSYREIGDELELSQPAVETLLFRARRSLANGLTELPNRKRRARLRSGFDIGSILLAFKAAFAGGGAVKVAAVAAVATTTAIAGTKVESLQDARTHTEPLFVAHVARPAAHAVPTRVAPTRVKAASAAAASTPATRPVRHVVPVRRATVARPTPTRPVVAPTPVAEPSPTPPADVQPEQADPEPAVAASVPRTEARQEDKQLDRRLGSDPPPGANGRHKGHERTPGRSPAAEDHGMRANDMAPPVEEPAPEPEPAAEPAAAAVDRVDDADSGHGNGKHGNPHK